MTARGRFTQADMERVLKAATKAAEGDCVRVVFKLDSQEIEVFIGEPVRGNPAPEGWGDDDV
ncbi:MAG: hypothetical protein KYX66_06770 [Blastomonas fulva]|uniref:hypothetical protein n=1 Tax=Blastomonas fulva TaxID=1550728 RepID=UPI0024E1ADC5|nr:hypothetical protein [Blastomonas fulva]MDK2756422.1 hypothetical protein [Blastomonas fulva]